MQIFWNIADYQLQSRPIVTIGVFDGVHLGHQQIITQCVTEAQQQHTETTLVTFHPHPRLVVQPNANVQLLQTTGEKLECFEKLGIDHVLVIPFTQEFSKTSSSDFIKNILVDQIHVRKVIVGHDHSYGHSREGGIEHLQAMGNQYQFEVEQIEPISQKELTVSSSAIRDTLAQGNVRLASQLLGRFYTLPGTVVPGNQLGREIGFRTANTEPEPTKIIPANGVYACLATHKGQVYKCMTNIGIRPTVGGKKLVVETHLLDFSGDIYSEELILQFVDRIRDEVHFETMEALSLQLMQDKASTEKILNGIY